MALSSSQVRATRILIVFDPTGGQGKCHRSVYFEPLGHQPDTFYIFHDSHSYVPMGYNIGTYVRMLFMVMSNVSRYHTIACCPTRLLSIQQPATSDRPAGLIMCHNQEDRLHLTQRPWAEVQERETVSAVDPGDLPHSQQFDSQYVSLRLTCDFSLQWIDAIQCMRYHQFQNFIAPPTLTQRSSNGSGQEKDQEENN